MSLNDKIDEANKSEHTSGSSGWFKMKEGKNQFRILTEPEIMFENYGKGICYHQCGFEGTTKYLARILDRADNKVKMYKIPFGIFKQIATWEADEDLAFSGFPMPYDVKVNAKNAGSKEVEYTVMASPKQVPVEQETLNFLAKQSPVKEVIVKMQDKNIEKHKEDGTWQKEQDRLAELAKDLAKGGTAKEEDTIEYPVEDLGGDSPF
jgi:hypothetical protein